MALQLLPLVAVETHADLAADDEEEEEEGGEEEEEDER